MTHWKDLPQACWESIKLRTSNLWPMSLIPREIRERRDDRGQEDRDRERSKSPSPEEGTREEGTREVRMNDDRGRSEDSEDRRDDRLKRFRYEETSSDSEMNFIGQGQQQPPQPENSKAALNVVWATVDSGAATSCLPVELCQEKGLEVERTSDLPYTNASGAPVRVHGICHSKVTIGNQDESKVAGTGMFKAMDVAKPLLSVARLVNKGWEVCQAWELLHEVPRYHHSLRGKRWCIRFP